MDIDTPPNAGDFDRRCLPVADAPVAPDAVATQRARWTVRFETKDGEANGAAVVDWALLPRAGKPAAVTEVCVETQKLAPDFVVELKASWLELPTHGQLELRLTVRGPRAASETPAEREGQYAFPYDIIKRSVRVEAAAAKLLDEGHTGFEDFTFPRKGGMVELRSTDALEMQPAEG